MTRLASVFSRAHTRERPLSNLYQLLIVLGVMFICGMIFWTVVYATTPFKPYHVAGFATYPTTVCPLETVTIDVVDELRQGNPLIDMSKGRIEIRSSFAGVTGEPAYSELTFPIDLTHMRNGGNTSFSRLAPDQPGQYIIKSRVIVKGYVAGFPFPRTVEFPIADNAQVVTVKSPLDTSCSTPSGEL